MPEPRRRRSRAPGAGIDSPLGFKLAGGGARKMTHDDIEENTEKFVELLGQL